MKKLVYPAVDFLLFGNIFMALCAVAQGLVTFILIGAQPVYIVLFILFLSTLFIYNFSIVLSKPADPQKSQLKRVRWFFKNFRLMIIITVICALLLLPMFFLVSGKSKLLLLTLAIVSLGYGLPIFSAGKQKFGLRNIPGLKLLMIGITWALSVVLLPVFETSAQQHIFISNQQMWLLLLERLLFITAMAIPFDIRDLFQDRHLGLKTLPVVFGEKNAYLLCQILLGLYLLMLFLFTQPGTTTDFYALLISILVASWLLFHSKFEKNEYYYFFYVDGVLILQYLLMVGFRFLIRY